jgi:hypothetical protein
VAADVSVDPASGLFHYLYTVRNSGASILPINYFTLALGEPPTDIKSPANWFSRYINLSTVIPNLRWATIVATPSAFSGPNALSLPVPAYAIQPGRQLGGFSVNSSLAPGVGQYYVEGVTQIPASVPTSSDDENQPDCSGWDFKSPRLQTLVTGMVTVPSSPTVISVVLRLRREHGEPSYGPINPHTASGRIAVLIKSSRQFDTADLDVSSVRFGPGQALPLVSSLIRSSSHDDQGDEREEWEKVRANVRGDSDQDRDKRDLLLVFDLKALAIQCVLDKALFLTGSTYSGVHILGGASIRTVDCDMRKPDRRRGARDR